MAKSQSFGDKVNKESHKENNLKHVKVIRAKRSKKNNALKFNEQMLAVDANKSLDAAVKEFLNK